MTKLEKHEILCKRIGEIYKEKNKRYGDSFGKTFSDFGLVMSCIRISDKYERFKTLVTNPELDTDLQESILDTLMDLANYALMTIIEIDVGGVITNDMPKM